jgi:hypothetical protein
MVCVFLLLKIKINFYGSLRERIGVLYIHIAIIERHMLKNEVEILE